MSSKEKQYIKEYLTRMIAVNRSIEGISSKTYSELNKVHQKIIKEIKGKYSGVNSKTLKELTQILNNQLHEYHVSDIKPTVDEAFNEIITKELVWSAANLELFTGTAANMINSAAAASKALKKTYQGHTFNFWFNAADKTVTKRLENVLRQGYVTGTTTQEVLQQVEALLGRSGNDIKTLTRSYLQHASVEAREETYAANEDVIAGYYWVATLDHRTTANICGIRDGKLYDTNHKPVGHSLPWGQGPGRIHFNCRSSQIAQIKNMPDVRDYLTRASVDAGEKYERGDDVNRNGKVRKPNKKEREKGIFEISQVQAKTNFESYLKRQKVDFIADVLNNEQLAKDFKAGRISLLEISLQGKAAEINTL